MRKFAIAMLCLFASAGALGTSPARAQDGIATFRFINKANYIIYIKMYSATRNHVWPGPASHYALGDHQEHFARLACQVGEKICFGGGYLTDGTGMYWGVGYLGNMGCQACCLVCGTPSEEVSHGWELSE